MRNGTNKLVKTLIISITKDKVTVTNGGEILLVTNNNINAYLKLYEALEGQKASIYILEHWGMKIGSSVTKEDFLAILRRWFEN